MKCLCCGIETEKPLCEVCGQNMDIRAFAEAVFAYEPWNGENALWNEIASSLVDQKDFRDLAFVLAGELPSPQKEYMQIKTIAANKLYFPAASSFWLYDTASVCLGSGLTESEENDVRAWMLSAKAGDYAYAQAEEHAQALLAASRKNLFQYRVLCDYLIKTRRNDLADILLQEVKPLCRSEKDAAYLRQLAEENEKKREKPYLPAQAEKEENYNAFMATLGVEVQTKADIRKANAPIAKEAYPEEKERTSADFSSFVAFDLETTGRASYDDIIEIGAVKVVNGVVTEDAAFCFQTFVKPMEKKVTPEITALTGITKEDVQSAPTIKEALTAFLDFAGNSVLLGFNCMAFDSRFLTRAGRYAHIIIENEYFDVMRYAEIKRAALGLPDGKPSLASLAAHCGIGNPQAHRALADALTTARVFLKLRGNDDSPSTAVPDLDDLLAGL